VPEGFILFTDPEAKSIYRMDLSTRNYVKIPIESHDTPLVIDYDYRRKQIYWIDVGRKMILTATLDGGNTSRTFRILSDSK